MRTVEMFPEGSHRLACDPRVTRPTSPVIKKEEAPGLDLELLGGFVDGAPKKSRKKVVLADHVVPPCTLCARAKTNTKCEQPRRPLRDPHGDPAKGVMLVVLNAFSDGVRYATEVIRAAGWEGQIYFDLPVRCGDGRKKIESKQVDACRTYLAYNMLVIKPTHILTCGTTASRAVLGKTVMVHQTRGAWQLAEFRGRKVGVVATCSTIDASTNRFYAKAFKDEVTKLVTTEWQALEFPRGVASVVENQHDLQAFKAWLRGAPFVAFDTETYGIQFRKDFRILSIAFSKPGSDEVFVFREALDNPLCLAAVKQALSSKLLWGANVQYDVRSVWCAWGLDISANLEVDVRLLYKSFWAGFASDLEEMANTVGFGQHKAEAAVALKAAKEELKEEWEDWDDAPRDRIMAYAYAKLPPEIHERYVARDAYTTRCVGDHLVPLAKDHEFIWQHFDEVIMPACRKLLRIERRGMLFDRIKAKSVRMMVEERLAHYTIKLLNEGIDPDKADTIRAYFDREGIKINRLTKGAKQEAEERGYVLDTDKRSTDKRALLQAKLVVAAVKPQLEIISDCLEHRKVSKLHSANLKTIDRYIGDDGRCHPNFLLSTAGSGRATCKDPAAHSVPGRTEEGKAFKSCFIAPPGYVIAVFDYNTLEVFGAAFASNDAAMLDVLEPEDADFHLATAKKIAPLAWGITAEEVQRRFDAAKAAGKKCKERDQAKMVGLATMYGIGDEALAENIGSTKQEAGGLIRAFRTIYPDYRQWVLEMEEFVRKNGYTQAYWCGRKSRMRWLYDAGYPDPKRRSHALRAGSNHPIQSECSDYCLASGVVIEDRLEAEFDDPDTGIIMEVHDSIVMQIREDLLVPVARMVKEVMTSWPAGPFPLRVSAEVGPSWGEAVEWFFPPELPAPEEAA